MERPTRLILLRHQLLLVLVAGLIFFTNLGAAALFDEDEAKNAVCGREMFLRGDWIVPTFNDGLRTDKPILIYWLMLGAYNLFGVSEFAARFCSALLAVGTTLATYHLGRKLFNPEVGLWGALVLCTSLMFAAVGRSVTPDSTLICCTTSAFLGYIWATAARHGGRFGQPIDDSTKRHWSEFVPATWLHAVPMYVAMGFAVLAKGPIGVLLPCTIIGMFLLIRQQLDHSRSRVDQSALPRWRLVLRTLFETFSPLRILRGCLAMRVPLGAVLVAAIALPWYIAVGVQTDGEWLAGFLGNHNVGRFLAPKENHSGPIVYYVPVILLGCMPWSLFVPVSMWRTRQKLSQPSATHAAELWLLTWAGVWIGFFSFASTKLPNYVLPAYPAIALLVGSYLTEWRHASQGYAARLFRNGCRLQAVCGVAILIGFPILAGYFLPEEQMLALIGAIPLIGAIAAYGYACQHKRLRAVRSLTSAAVALAVTVVGICPERVARHQDGPVFGRLVKGLPNSDEAALGVYEYFAPNLVYYAERHIHRLEEPAAITEFFATYPQGLLLTRDDRLEALEAQLPSDVTVLEKRPRFLRRHDLVLLGRPLQTVEQTSHTELR